MEINLWFFLTACTVFSIGFAIVAIVFNHKTKIKELEIEALNIKKATLKAEVEEAVNNKLSEHLTRIEILEAIVTDQNYDLNEKITKLK